MAHTEVNTGELTAAIRGALDAFDVVGAAAAIVHHDAALVSDGFGVRDTAGGSPVDQDTLFAIGSATKAFTALSIAQLHEAGLLDWDTPVQRYLPDFALHDRFVSTEATPRDLATHRVGLPRHEFSWYKAPLSRAELVARLRYLELSRPFRTTFQYQNMMYVTLGYLVERLTGSPWEAYVEAHILSPLGMTRTNLSAAAAQADANHAQPYSSRDGQRVAVPFADIDAMAPAGAINSSARDLARWMRLQLSGGVVDGTRIASTSSIHMLHTPHMVIAGDPDTDAQLLAPAYGLGWFTGVYGSHRVVHHGGNIDGFTALVLLVPDQSLGVAVVCNQEISPMPAAAAFAVVDRVLGLPHRDWNAEYRERYDKMLGAVNQGGNFSAERVEGTAPSRPLEAFAGQYEHPAYGTLTVSLSAGGLQLTYHVWPAPLPLEHFHYDVFVVHAAVGAMPVSWRVPFQAGVDGAVESVEVQLEPMAAPIVFKRKAPAVQASREELAQMEGHYVVAGVQNVAIALQGEELVATIEGQPPVVLVATGVRRFGITGLTGYSVQFDAPVSGQCPGGRFVQPNGIFSFVRVDGAR